MNYSGILHSSIIVRNTQTSLKFYTDILGLALDEKRPDLGYPGAWLEVNHQQIHLLEVPNPDPVTDRPQHGGRDRHTAIGIDNIEKLKQTLKQNNVYYSESKSGRRALFCRDPDGNALEFIETSMTT